MWSYFSCAIPYKVIHCKKFLVEWPNLELGFTPTWLNIEICYLHAPCIYGLLEVLIYTQYPSPTVLYRRQDTDKLVYGLYYVCTGHTNRHASTCSQMTTMGTKNKTIWRHVLYLYMYLIWVWPDHCEGGWSGNIGIPNLFYWNAIKYVTSQNITPPPSIMADGCTMW